MPQKSRLKLPSLDLGEETLGQRIARLRKERGYTQSELAEKIGLVQNLVSAYECDRLGLQADMVIRFAKALEVSTDELLGLRLMRGKEKKPSLKVLRRLQKIQGLPLTNQKVLLKTIDTFIKAAEK